MEYLIWCDESVKKGKHYSNFYGGILVRSIHIESVVDEIRAVRAEHNLHKELKWQKVTDQYLSKYIAVINKLFDLMEKDLIKVRIMFRHNVYQLLNLTQTQVENEFFILYYHFFKHAFGLSYSDEGKDRPIYIRAYFDLLPDTIEKRYQFREFIKGLEKDRNFQKANIRFRKDAITEVDSKKHDLLQCMDIILGSMAFRLNDMHKEKLPGTNKRGKRTIAKEKLYKLINHRIRKLYPGFNIGVSTGHPGGASDRWRQPYRHWSFVSRANQIDETYYK